ncbi:MAG: peptidylprolyl isomerase [Bacteroidales bacterium]
MDGIFARIKTPKGEILIELEYEKTPLTVANFIGLAEGLLENTVKPLGTPFYDGLNFHRVISIANGDAQDFMIQGGCPQGSGTGDPGYKFRDEFHKDLRHDVPGVLSMANSGPASNGSQFFITHVATPWLDGKHTVFGKVVEGLDVVMDTLQGDKIESLTIERRGAGAESFDAKSVFEAEIKALADRDKQERERAEAEIEKLSQGYKKSSSGLRYNLLQVGDGEQAKAGHTVKVHYEGKLSDGTLFDSSYKRERPIEFPLGAGHVIKGWDEGISLLKVGDKAQFVIPPHLGYGSAGAGGVIPPNSVLVFDVELLAVK